MKLISISNSKAKGIIILKTCPYCSTKVKTDEDTGFGDCSFCEMQVKPAEDGKREKIRVYEPVTHADMELPTRDLMGWNTYRLMELLKKLREERRSQYHYLKTFKQASNEVQEYKDVAIETGNEYENITKKTFAVENILRDRIGYIPRKVTTNTLGVLAERMEHDRNLKPMQIKKPQEHQPPPRQPSPSIDR